MLQHAFLRFFCSPLHFYRACWEKVRKKLAIFFEGFFDCRDNEKKASVIWTCTYSFLFSLPYLFNGHGVLGFQDKREFKEILFTFIFGNNNYRLSLFRNARKVWKIINLMGKGCNLFLQRSLTFLICDLLLSPNKYLSHHMCIFTLVFLSSS